MRRLASVVLLLALIVVPDVFGQEAIRYVFVDADCEAGFEVLPGTDQKHILTNVKVMTFDDPGMVLFAENEVKDLFKLAIKDKYPQSVNRLKGVYVYILNSSEEARLKREELADSYQRRGMALIDLEF